MLIGKAGENIAVEYYINKDFCILYKNWRFSNKGELDIIAYHKDKDILVVCEVKTRKFGSALRGCYSVNLKKQQKIRFLTSVFIQQNIKFSESYIRFDVADLIYDIDYNFVKDILIIENAF